MKTRRVLFVQATEPAGYPPLLHAARLMAGAGWEVTFLSAPTQRAVLEIPQFPHREIAGTRCRPSHVMGKADYLRYGCNAARLARRLRPDVVYASDPLGAWPGRLAARLSGAKLVYHEHDSPAPGALNRWIDGERVKAARMARVVVFPNDERARIAARGLGFGDDRLHIVWNLPCRAELPAPRARRDDNTVVLYYHGGICPERLPEAVVEAIANLQGKAQLRVAGRETPGAEGYVARLRRCGRLGSGDTCVEHLGQVSRQGLLDLAAQADIGLALMPLNSSDVNLRHMAGASNKAFDYMAAGLALLVSDLPDWRRLFVASDYGRACNPSDPRSIADALRWFIDHPNERRAMAKRARAQIESQWNYDTAFAPVLAALSRS